MASLTEGNGRGSGKNLKVQFEDPPVPEETKPILCYSRSVSLISTSDSSSESGLVDHDLPIEDKDGEQIIELQTPALAPNERIICPSPVWSFPGASSSSVTQSPPIQTMASSVGYDPNRIPASVFSSKPNTESSLASNESLFSIHPGNSSFSRDHVFLFSKSGKVPKSGDLVNIPDSLSAGRDINELLLAEPDQSSDGASVKISELADSTAAADQSPKLCGEESGTTENLSEPAKSVVKQIQEEKIQNKITPTEEVLATATNSFHFPRMAVDNGRGSSPTVESEKHSIQMQPPQLPQPRFQQQEMSREEEMPELHARTRWFSCFSCRSCCCF